MPSRQPRIDDIKKRSLDLNPSDRSQKRAKLLLDDSSDADESLHSESGGVSVKHENGHILGVNQEFAQRFEHNKKREELQRCAFGHLTCSLHTTDVCIVEEKYGSHIVGTKYRGRGGEDYDDANDFIESSTDSEDEDDEGILVSERLDAEIEATLHALRAKDPRVYDEKARFYADFNDEEQDTPAVEKSQSKPMYLSDYHRENLLAGDASTDMEDKNLPTYAQQQHDLRQTVIREMHLAVDGANINSAEGRNPQADPEDDDGFLVKKLPELRPDISVTSANGSSVKLNPQDADKDPESFLSHFMSTRAWVAPVGSKMQPFESDDEEEERRAEAFEEAYNLRFEDPKGSNEKLLSHARDAAAKYSVRKEQLNGRKKTRELERAKKEIERHEREEDKKRLRKLRIANAEEKIRKIEDAAGLRGNVLEEQDWSKFIDEAWDDDRWEKEMMKRFGDEYYASRDPESGDDGTGNRKRKVKKPRWNDDIEIQDIVPDFEESTQKPYYNLTDDESKPELPVIQQHEAVGDEYLEPSEAGPKKTVKEEKASQRKVARQQRRKIEEIVDQRLNVEDTLSGLGTKQRGSFRYRDTSPLAYGLTAHDILMATDSQLNQFAGLKKMAAFRDKEKKKKDKKMLGKKARLRQWRKETFGNEDGPQNTLAEVIGAQTLGDVPGGHESKDVIGPKKSRSRRKGKVGARSSSRHAVE